MEYKCQEYFDENNILSYFNFCFLYSQAITTVTFNDGGVVW